MKDGEVAFEWFERADYPNIRRVMEDQHRLPASFEEWEKSAEAGEQALANSRHIVVRTIIESQSFALWCRERELKGNAQSRLKYCKEQHASTFEAAEYIGDASPPTGVQVEDVAVKVTRDAPDLRRGGMKFFSRFRHLAGKMMRGVRSLSPPRR